MGVILKSDVSAVQLVQYPLIVPRPGTLIIWRLLPIGLISSICFPISLLADERFRIPNVEEDLFKQTMKFLP